MAALPPGSTIGILGGGQLGRLMAMAAARLGYHAIILDPDPACPAAEVAGGHIVAPYDDPGALDRLAGACAVVTYEFENVPVEGARLLEGKVAVRPGPRALEVAQDRVVEKTFLNAIGIETARFAAIDSPEQAATALARLTTGGVLKTRRFGYDGKGQAVLNPGDDAAAAFAALGSQPGILEEKIAFACEISVVAARAIDGQLAAYDAARNEHSGGILRRSTIPSGVSPALAAQARDKAFAILEALDYVGVVGVEFFVGSDGRLLVNEIAPRVHNSGHWTEAACFVSQFELHVRAVAGLPLGGTGRHSDCVMENLIGDEIERATALAAEPRVVLNLYGKAETRPGRKMGHFTRLTGPVSAPAG